jgi:hypothetical protein
LRNGITFVEGFEVATIASQFDYAGHDRQPMSATPPYLPHLVLPWRSAGLDSPLLGLSLGLISMLAHGVRGWLYEVSGSLFFCHRRWRGCAIIWANRARASVW